MHATRLPHNRELFPLLDRRAVSRSLAEQSNGSSARPCGSLDDYLAGLQLQVIVKEADESDLPRVAQLIQKTNQFNLSAMRRTMEEVRSLSEAKVFVASVSDRFGEYGSVGVAILRTAEETFTLDTLLLSCRVLGRHVEHAFLSAIRTICIEQGATTLAAKVAETPRNEPARQFVREVGFLARRADLWEWDLSEPYSCPSQIDLQVCPREHGSSTE